MTANEIAEIKLKKEKKDIFLNVALSSLALIVIIFLLLFVASPKIQLSESIKSNSYMSHKAEEIQLAFSLPNKYRNTMISIVGVKGESGLFVFEMKLDTDKDISHSNVQIFKDMYSASFTMGCDPQNQEINKFLNAEGVIHYRYVNNNNDSFGYITVSKKACLKFNSSPKF